MTSTSSESIQWTYCDPNLDGVEDVEKYVVSGYHLVNIGDMLGEKEKRYEGIHKLRSGGFSTVWLARLVNTQGYYYALKILCASATDDMELNILRHLQKCAATHPNISSLNDVFQINRPNGLHYCLVLPVLGPSIKDMSDRQLPKSLRHKASQQIASGLAYLHSLEICHGDLTYANVLFELQDIQSWSKIQIYEHLGPARTASLKLLDGSYSPHAPKKVVQAVKFSNIGLDLLGNIRITDFSQSFFTKDPPDGLGTPPSFFAAEMYFGIPPSKSSDI
ncbi:kinase domain-containing protein, partial [Leptodontidium sp. MPI-SDFR-AT-0119]